MAIEVGSWGLIEDEVIWKVAAGSDAYLGPFVLLENDDPDSPELVDLTGYEGGSQIRRKLGGEVIGEMTSAGGEVQINPVTAEVLFHLPAEQSREWSHRWTDAVFDAELYAPDGTVQRFCTGRLQILPNSTREEDFEGGDG